MKAAILHQVGDVPRYGDFADPTPAQGEVMVRVTAASLKSSDKMMASGAHYESHAELPRVCGIDGVGVLDDGTRVFCGGPRPPFGMMAERTVFEAFGVPMLYFHDWPDPTIHTNKDVPENLDATKLGRVAYMTAGIAWTLAALPDADAAATLVPLERAATDERLAQARHDAAADGRSAADAALAEREAVAVGRQALAGVAALWPGAAAAARRAAGALPAPAGRVVPSRDPRVPVKDPVVRGDLEVYYYDYIAEKGGGDATALPLAKRSPVLGYDAFNFVDGKRSVGEIRDLLAGRYGPVPLAEVQGWFDLLAKAGAVTYPRR